ncbi:MAG: tetratricopeptide repeat protein [Woeseiaceae bacterium]
MNTTTIKTVRTLLVASIAAVMLGACGQSGQDDAAGDQGATADGMAAKVPITTTSDEARTLYTEGRALLDDLHIVEANEKFMQAASVDDSFAMAYYRMAFTAQTNADFFDATAKAKERAGNASEGEQLYIKALAAGADNDQATQRDALEELMGMYPDDERTHVALANFLLGQQDFSGAIAHFGHATAIAPEFASAYNALGYAHRNVDDLDSALAAFEKYVELIPDRANPYDSLAELQMEMGDYDASIANYRKALTIDPYFAASYAGISINQSLKGEPERAQEAADEMLAAARNFGERQGAMFRSVTSHIFAGDYAAAEEICEVMMAEAEVAGNRSTMGGIAEYMGDMMMTTGDAAAAEKHFDAALEYRTQANLSEANVAQAARAHLFKTAIAAMIGGDSEAAASRTAEYIAAAEANGTAFEKRRVHELSGYLAMNQEDHESAAAHFENSSKLQPVPLYWSAVVNKDLGNTDKARDLAKRASKRNTLNGNLPFFQAAAVELLAELESG